MRIRNRRGMALVIVLTLAMGLSVLAASYLHTIRQQQPINPLLLSSAQADILAQGIGQIATLKFKELPGPFYYSFIASTKGNATFLDTFKGDALLAGNVTSPFEATFFTEYTLFSSKMYQEMNLRIAVNMNIQTRDGRTHSRVVEQTLNGIRQRTN